MNFHTMTNGDTPTGLARRMWLVLVLLTVVAATGYLILDLGALLAHKAPLTNVIGFMAIALILLADLVIRPVPLTTRAFVAHAVVYTYVAITCFEALRFFP